MTQFDRNAALPDPDDVRDPRAAAFHRDALSESTREKYRFFLSAYLDWCETVDRREVPATASTLEAFAVHLTTVLIQRGKNRGQHGFAPNSIRLAMAAVRKFHRVQGFPAPDLGLADGVIAGHARRRAQDPGHAFTDGQGAPGLRLPRLREMFGVCLPDTVAGARDRALLSLGWATMARRSELARLGVADVPTPDERGLAVLIRRSKTDQLGRGRTVRVPWKPELGELCPVANVVRWQQVSSDLGVVDDGFFRGVDQHGRVNGLPGWAGSRQSSWMDPTTVEWVVVRAATRAVLARQSGKTRQQVEAELREAGRFTAHSLRRGGATDLYEHGADILAIARQGGWGERSPVIFRYIEDSADWGRNALNLAQFG